MKSSMCENCIKYKTIYCPNSDECLAREDKPFYEDKYTILTKHEALEEKLKDYTKIIQQLKIQISAREDTILEQRQENSDLEDNWNKLKAFIVNEIPEDKFINDEYYVSILDKMQELERGVSDAED